MDDHAVMWSIADPRKETRVTESAKNDGMHGTTPVELDSFMLLDGPIFSQSAGCSQEARRRPCFVQDTATSFTTRLQHANMVSGWTEFRNF